MPRVFNNDDTSNIVTPNLDFDKEDGNLLRVSEARPVGRVGRNLTALGLSTLFSRILNFAAIVLLAKHLLADGYGLIVYAQTAVSYFQLVTDFGLGIYGTRELARERQRAAWWAGAVLSARGVTTLIGICLLLVFMLITRQSAIERDLLLLFGLGLPVSMFTLDWVFQAVEEMRYIGLGRIAQAAIYLLLVILFVREQQDIVVVPVLVAVSLLVFNIILGVIFIRQYGLPRLSIDGHRVWLVLRASAAFGLSGLMILIYYNADRLILAFFRSDAEVGWYDAAYRFVLLFSNTAGLIAQAILPGLAAMAKQKDLDRARSVVRLVAKAMIYVGAPIAVGGTFMAGSIVELVYGPEYAPSVGVLQIIIWQAFTIFVILAFAQALLAFDQQKLYFYSVALGAFVNLVSNAFLIPSFGMIGAAVATIISEVVVVASLYYFSSRFVFYVSVIEPLLKAGLACGGMAVAIRLVSGSWYQIVIGVLVYAVLLVLMAPFTSTEWAQLLRGQL